LHIVFAQLVFDPRVRTPQTKNRLSQKTKRGTQKWKTILAHCIGATCVDAGVGDSQMSIDSTKQEGGQEKGEIILGSCVDPGVRGTQHIFQEKGGGGGGGGGKITCYILYGARAGCLGALGHKGVR